MPIDRAAFASALDEALVAINQNYTARAVALTADYSTGVSADIKLAIDDKAKHTMNGIAKEIGEGQQLLDDCFKDPHATNLQFVQANVGMACYQVEFVIRGRLELLEHYYSAITNRTKPVTEEDIALIFRPNEIDATVKAAVSKSASEGNTGEKMYIDGVTSIYAQLDAQIQDYLNKVNGLMQKFEQGPIAAVTADDDEIAKDDVDAVHEDTKPVLNFKVPELTKLVANSYPADLIGDKLVDAVVKDVCIFYNTTFANLYALADVLFTDMSTLQFDAPQTQSVAGAI